MIHQGGLSFFFLRAAKKLLALSCADIQMTDWSLQFATTTTTNSNLSGSNVLGTRKAENVTTLSQPMLHISYYTLVSVRGGARKKTGRAADYCALNLCLAALADDLTPTTRSNFIIPLSNPQAY